MEKIRSSVDSYSLLEFLGNGSFAEVWHAKSERASEDVAIKIVDKSKLPTRIRIDGEIRIHSVLNHPSVVKLFNHFEDTKHVYLVMELCRCGTLQDYLRSRGGQLTENETRPLFHQIVEAVHYLHSRGIIHRDLSLSNVLLSDNSTVKISDFGLAKQLHHKDEKHSTMCGTPNFISPEIVTQRPHGLEADMFSLGCILYTLLVGKPPFDTKALGSTLSRVRRVDFSMPDYLSPYAKSLISALLKKDPRERLSLQGILCHPFLQKDQVSFKKNHFQGLQDSGLGSTVTTLSSNGDSSYARNPFYQGQLSVIFSERSYVSCQSNSASSRSNREHPRNCMPVCGQQPSSKSKTTICNAEASSEHEFKNPLPSYAHCHGNNERVIARQHQEAAPIRCSPQPSLMYSEADGYSQVQERSICSHVDVACATYCMHAKSCCCHLRPVSSQQHPCPESNHQHLPEKVSSIEVKPRWAPGCDSLADVTPPVTTQRLKATRQRTKNAVVSITESREVILEFLRLSGKQEKVKSVCKISADGMKICIQKPTRGVFPANGLTFCGEETVYSYQTLPRDHWPKYEYAARFISLVQAKTPKVTFYSSQAKFILMESKTDFEAEFYDGQKITLASNLLKILTLGGKTYTIGFDEEFEPDCDTTSLLNHFREGHKHCINIEGVLALVESKTLKACFPVIIGRRPGTSVAIYKGSNKENCPVR